MPRKTYYLFDETIAPLRQEEKQIIEEHRILSIKVDKIYERTDKVIKLHKKTEKEKDKKRKRQEEEERIQLKKKQKQEEELQQKQQLLEKTENFDENYTQFKQEFYRLFNQVKILRSNFECTKDKINEIENLRKNFTDKCIHPELSKTIGYYNYEVDDGGGSGFGHSTYVLRECNACNLCKSQDKKNTTSFWHLSFEDKNLEFSEYSEFDSEDNIKKLNKDIEKIKVIP